MKKLMLSLLLVILCHSCGKRIETNCPHFPIPSDNAKITLNIVSENNKDVYVWLNQLLDLCEKLGTCSEE